MSGPESNQDLVPSGVRIPGDADCLQHLLSLAQQPHSNMVQLADAIEQDPALLYDYLRHSQPGDLVTWYDSYDPQFARVVAISRGLDLLRENGSATEASRHRLLWKRSLGTAVINRELAGCLFGGDAALVRRQREAYLIGLLADIGELANSVVEPPAQQDPEEPTGHPGNISRAMTEAAARSAAILEEVLGNPLLVDAVRFRGWPADSLADSHWLVRSLAASSAMVNLLLEPQPPQQQEYKFCEQLLGLSANQVDQCINEATRIFRGITEKSADNRSSADSSESRPVKDDQPSRLRDTIADSSILAVIANLLEQSADMASWWRNVQLIGRLVFGFGDSFLFKVDKAGRQLISAETNAYAFSISLDNPRSMLARTVTDRRVSVAGKKAELAVVDQQLLGLADARSLICVPLYIDDEITGVLAFGAMEEHTTDYFPLNNLLERYTELIAEQYRRRVMARALTEDSALGIDPEYFQIRAREVTHEINNPLSVVQNYMKILSMKLGEDNSVQGDLKTISEEINRISGIVEKFSQIASESKIGASVINLNVIVRDIVNVFKGSAPDVRFVLQLGENIPSLDISRDAIKQVLVNLLKNALEAMGNTGNIVVRTSGQVNLGGEPYIEILISDDGPGISEEVKKRLFKQVNTSKGADHGGLGLTIVKKLIDEMNGYISARSGVETGTDFQILLPVSSNNNSE